MNTPVGEDWERLPPIEEGRKRLEALLQIGGFAEGESFVEAAGRILKAIVRGQVNLLIPESCEDITRNPGGNLKVPLWDRLAEDLPKDPDFRTYVCHASRTWLRKNDDVTPATVIVAFAYEGLACTVDHAQSWYDQRPTRTGKWYRTWVTLLKAQLGRKPVSRLVKVLQGRRVSEGEKRKDIPQPAYPGQAVTDVTKGNDAYIGILDGNEGQDDQPDIVLMPEQVEALSRAWSSLPDNLRRTLELRYLKGANYQEIGEALLWTQEEVVQKLRQALNQLKKYLNPGSSEEKS